VHLAGDPLLGPLVRAHPGRAVPGTWDPFETGVRAIAGQQVSVAGATTLTGRIATELGRPVPGLEPLGLTHLFPSADCLAGTDLSGLGFTAARASAIAGFATAVRDDRIRLDRSAPLDEFVASVTAVAGLGPWTAHYLAYRLGEPDAFPAGDLGLRRAVTPPGAERMATERDLTARADSWRPWRALAATHLWTSAAAAPTAALRPAS
jgi:AraC family transcriptional regulator of adaptative response / DNA-3-methyladenine glycosylase II